MSMPRQLLAFKNTTVTKSGILSQLRAHAEADQIVKGQYWENGKGCAVGCTVHSRDHAEYETRFGIPIMLARLEDCIFEGLPDADAMTWPIRFMQGVPEGADLSRVGWQFLHWLLTDKTVNSGIDHPTVRDAVRQCADMLIPLTRGEPVDKSAQSGAAWSAAWGAVWSAAADAEGSAEESAAWSAAWGMAESAAADAEASAEGGAAWGAAWSAAWGAVWSATEGSAAYVKMAEKLIGLIEAAE